MLSNELKADARRLYAKDPPTFEKAIESIKKSSRLDIITEAAEEILAIAKGGKR